MRLITLSEFVSGRGVDHFRAVVSGEDLYIFGKIQLVVYYQCCVLIG